MCEFCMAESTEKVGMLSGDFIKIVQCKASIEPHPNETVNVIETHYIFTYETIQEFIPESP